jgi:hypothetical protein
MVAFGKLGWLLDLSVVLEIYFQEIFELGKSYNSQNKPASFLKK